MRRAATVLLMVMVLGTALQAGARPVGACTCGPTASPGPNPSAAPWDNAAVIVVGEVEELRVVPPFDPGNPDPGNYAVEAVFEVMEYIKGAGAETLVLQAHLGVNENGEIRESFAGCQFITPRSEGDRFVLFSGSGVPTGDPGYCGASRGVSGLNDSYLDAIRAGVQVTPTPTVTPSPSPTPPPSVSASGGTRSVSGTATASAGALPRSGGVPGGGGGAWVLGGLATVAGLTVLGAAMFARRRG